MVESVDKEMPGSTVIPKLEIANISALIQRLTFGVGVDSSHKHIAVLEGVPTVTLFGPTQPEIWDPLTDIHRAVYLNLECSPCRKKSCADNKCMKGIKPSTVLAIASNLMSSGKQGYNEAGREDERR